MLARYRNTSVRERMAKLQEKKVRASVPGVRMEEIGSGQAGCSDKSNSANPSPRGE